MSDVHTLVKRKRTDSTDFTGLAALLRDGVAAAFAALESELLKDARPTPPSWPKVAALPPAAQSWLTHALYLLRARDAATGPEFDRVAAVARLVRWARTPASEPGGSAAFEREVLAVSGWLEAVLPSRLAVPDLAPVRPAPEPYDDGRVRAALARWPLGVTPRAESEERVAALAAEVQHFLLTGFGPYPAARFHGPLYDGYVYADRVRSSEERPTGLDAQIVHLAEFTTADTGPLRERLAADPALSERVRHLIAYTPSHTGDPIHVPFAVPADGRSRLREDLVHGLLHKLAHPRLTVKAGPLLTEGLVRLLTAEVVTAMGVTATGATPAVTGATEVQEQVGSDRVRAAFFLGRAEFIGL